MGRKRFVYLCNSGAEPGGATLAGFGPFFERNLRWDRVAQSDHQMHHVMNENSNAFLKCDQSVHQLFGTAMQARLLHTRQNLQTSQIYKENSKHLQIIPNGSLSSSSDSKHPPV